MRVPSYPAEGEPVKTSWGREVVDAIRAMWPQPSPDILPDMGAGGTTYSSRLKSKRVPAEQKRRRDFDIASIDSNAAKVYLLIGELYWGGRVYTPNNTLVDIAPADPNTIAEYIPVTIGGTAENRHAIVARISISFGNTAFEIETTSSPLPITSTSSESRIPLYEVYYDTGGTTPVVVIHQEKAAPGTLWEGSLFSY